MRLAPLILWLLALLAYEPALGYPAWKCITWLVDCENSFLSGPRQLVTTVRVMNDKKFKDGLRLAGEEASEEDDLLRVFKVSHGTRGSYYFLGDFTYRRDERWKPSLPTPDGVIDVISSGEHSVTITKATLPNGNVEFLYDYSGEVPFSLIAARGHERLTAAGYSKTEGVLKFLWGPMIMSVRPLAAGGHELNFVDFAGNVVQASGAPGGAAQSFLIQTLLKAVRTDIGNPTPVLLHPWFN